MKLIYGIKRQAEVRQAYRLCVPAAARDYGSDHRSSMITAGVYNCGEVR